MGRFCGCELSVSQTSVPVQQRWHVAIRVTILTLKMKKLSVGRLQLECTPSCSEPRILSHDCGASLLLVTLPMALSRHPAHIPGCVPSDDCSIGNDKHCQELLQVAISPRSLVLRLLLPLSRSI